MAEPVFLTQVTHKQRLELAWKCYRVLSSGECIAPRVEISLDSHEISPTIAARRYAATFAGEARITIAVEVSTGYAVFFETRRRVTGCEDGVKLVPLAPEEPKPEEQLLRQPWPLVDVLKTRLSLASIQLKECRKRIRLRQEGLTEIEAHCEQIETLTARIASADDDIDDALKPSTEREPSHGKQA